MKITSITIQAKNKNRLNVSVDGKYRFSLDVYQLTDLGIKIGHEITESQLLELESESTFGKLYTQALEYTMLRPHSAKEIRDYLWRKTLRRKYKSRMTGEIKEREGISETITNRVYERLVEKNYINDQKFADWWVNNRNQTKGISQRKLRAELQAKGIENSIIQTALEEGDRDDGNELDKIITRKHHRYQDEQKFMAYLARQGFSYDEIKFALTKYNDQHLS